MSENYRPEEKSRYSEIYRPNEYNRSEERSCAVENFVSEEFRTRTESAKPSNGNKGKSDKLKKSLLGSGIITAVGTVAGAAVIVAAGKGNSTFSKQSTERIESYTGAEEWI